MPTKTKKAGRPKGAKTQPRDTVTAAPTRCKTCGSTEREPYQSTRRVPHSGWTQSNEPYTEVVFRTTRCRSCGQARVDIAHEYRPAAAPPDATTEPN